MRKVTLIGTVLLSLMLAAGGFAQTTIDFEEESVGGKPNGYTTADSAIAHFSDSMGANLDVATTSEAVGKGLRVFGDDASYLIIDFDVPQTSISLLFGNDDACCSNAGDEAVLTLYDGLTQVGQEIVVMNRNDLPDQTISYSGAAFDRATFFFDVTTSGLIEIVDNITFNNDAVAAPDITGTKTAAGDFLPGSTITYTIVLTNDGSGDQPDNADDEFVDVLPAELDIMSATATSGTATVNDATNTVRWNGSLDSGESVTITIEARIDQTEGTITNQGTIYYDSDLNGSNESSRTTDDPAAGGTDDPTTVTLAAVASDIPALSTTALMLFAALLGMTSLMILRR